MNLHEYQAKRLFADYGVAVPEHQVVDDVQAVDSALAALGGDRWVVKAQVHAGGRGKAGGVKIVIPLVSGLEVSTRTDPACVSTRWG